MAVHHSRTLTRFDKIVHAAPTASGVLAERSDTLHFMCISHGDADTFYFPYDEMTFVRVDKIFVGSPQVR